MSTNMRGLLCEGVMIYIMYRSMELITCGSKQYYMLVLIYLALCDKSPVVPIKVSVTALHTDTMILCVCVRCVCA